MSGYPNMPVGGGGPVKKNADNMKCLFNNIYYIYYMYLQQHFWVFN